MKSTHDYRREYVAARRRYGRAYNKWLRGKYGPERTELYKLVDQRTHEMREAQNCYWKRLASLVRKGSLEEEAAYALASDTADGQARFVGQLLGGHI